MASVDEELRIACSLKAKVFWGFGSFWKVDDDYSDVFVLSSQKVPLPIAALDSVYCQRWWPFNGIRYIYTTFTCRAPPTVAVYSRKGCTRSSDSIFLPGQTHSLCNVKGFLELLSPALKDVVPLQTDEVGLVRKTSRMNWNDDTLLLTPPKSCDLREGCFESMSSSDFDISRPSFPLLKLLKDLTEKKIYGWPQKAHSFQPHKQKSDFS